MKTTRFGAAIKDGNEQFRLELLYALTGILVAFAISMQVHQKPKPVPTNEPMLACYLDACFS